MKGFRILVILVVVSFLASLACAGEVKFVTYISDPHATSIYDRMQLPPGPPLPAENCVFGILYVNNLNGNLYFCDKASQWITFGSVWYQSDKSEVYPRETWDNPDIKVGTDGFPIYDLEIGNASSMLSSLMFVDADKGALRAGLNSETWKNGKIGEFSAAFGTNTEASGKYSFAAGLDSKASGEASFAFGPGAVASGTSSVAIGAYAKVSGKRSVVLSTSNDEIQNDENLKALEQDGTAGFFTNQMVVGSPVFRQVDSTPFYTDLEHTTFQVADKDMSVVSVKTKSQEYDVARVSQSTSIFGRSLNSGMYILDARNNKIPLSFDANGYTAFGDSSVPAENLIVVNGNMRVDGLAGEAVSAYACVDKEGTIYRSAAPCDIQVESLQVVCSASMMANPPVNYALCIPLLDYLGAGCPLGRGLTIFDGNYSIQTVPDVDFAQYPNCSDTGGDGTHVCPDGSVIPIDDMCLDGGGGEVCGDGFCAVFENCPADCGGGGEVCGNGICGAGENFSNCAVDCVMRDDCVPAPGKPCISHYYD